MNRPPRKPLPKGLLVSLIALGVFLQSSHFPARSNASLSDQSQGALNSRSINLPLIQKNVPPVNLASVWTSDANGQDKGTFFPNEAIRYNASGYNRTGSAATAKLTWLLDGPCGSSTLHSSTATLQPGGWSQFQAAVIPPCFGTQVYTLQLTYDKQTINLKTGFIVNPRAMVISNQQAFDKCNIPTISQMQTWWDKSPYRGTNIYIGGISRTCANLELNTTWIQAVSQQGWFLIPTWVGPQAPCSKYRYKMSANSQIAYEEGRKEADLAAAAITRIGITENRVIYYDLESFYGATQDCRNTVKSFMRGWVERLHESGVRAGGYGSPCTSYVSDWATINPMPDNVWVAFWNKEAKYDPNATVWNASCLDNSLWADHQRIRQYAGDHTETWGGVSFTVDSNVVDGEVTLLSQQALGASSLMSQSSIEASIENSSPQIRDMQLLSPEQGWVLVDQRLLWTSNGGVQWRDITPPAAAAGDLLAAHFTNEAQGWLMLQDSASGASNVLRTTDGGGTWQSFSIPASVDRIGSYIQSAYFSFVDTRTGWIALKFGSSSNFSLGMLFQTVDGGENWKELSIPVGGQVKFIDANRGWLTGGAAGNELYQTNDGGSTWRPQAVAPQEDNIPGNLFTGSPIFENSQVGLLPLTITNSHNPRVELYSTGDGGNTWMLASTVPLQPEAIPGSSVPVDMGDETHWFVAIPRPAQFYVIGEGGGTAQLLTTPGLLEGINQLQFISSSVGWAQVQNGNCDGVKPNEAELPASANQTLECEVRSLLLKTTDGGQTWIQITP